MMSRALQQALTNLVLLTTLYYGVIARDLHNLIFILACRP
jgi:hypothetical protein